uniref:brain-specific serine protease 4-like n=1 Tax=Styela clava TaxID=7725 RepID=UPI001939A71B|nr:brain-specific serine protease 4-like [Styela clava]XP_039271526.1 brain-specific serine protease 4-like [Styela clava]
MDYWLYVLPIIFLCGTFAQDPCEDSDGCEDVTKTWCSLSPSLKEICPKTCGTCPTTPKPTVASTLYSCEDDLPRCKAWKSSCDNNYVKTNCRKTCDLCGWSICTKSCGYGTRHRRVCDENGKCTEEYEECGTESCRSADCTSETEDYRYGIPHQCCKKESYFFSCGQSSVASKAVGGVNADRKRWPWTIAIIPNNNEFCGAVLVNNKFLVSAAHCFVNDQGNLRNTKKWKLYFGITKLFQDKPKEIRNIKSVTAHPEYKFPNNDIVVIEIDRKVKYSAEITPICLPGGEVTPQDTKCFVTGWGVSDKSGGSITTHMQEAGIYNLDRKICQEAYKDIPYMGNVLAFLNSNKGYLCAGHLTKKIDSCLGDSGGPLVCQRCDSCDWYLAGIVSFGHYDCGSIGVPGVYTSILDAEDWINSITGMKKDLYGCDRKYGP